MKLEEAREKISWFNKMSDRYLEAMKRVAEAISEITSWKWYEDVTRPGDLARVVRNVHGKGFLIPHLDKYPLIYLSPKDAEARCWFSRISWDPRYFDPDRIRVESRPIFGQVVCGVYAPRRRDIRRGLVVVRKWIKRANEKLKAEVKVGVLKGDKDKWFVLYYEVGPDVDSKHVKRNFIALKWAYDGTREEIEVERRIREEGL